MAAKKSLSHPGPRLLKDNKASAGGRWQASRTAWQRTLRPVARPADKDGVGIDWLRTLVAKGPARLQPAHLRRRPASAVPPCLHLIALDTSGSMRQGGRLAWAKGYAARLIEQAARAGDEVALLSFGGQGVELLLPPGPARTAGTARVRPLGGGGGTPLAAGLAEADRRHRQAVPARPWRDRAHQRPGPRQARTHRQHRALPGPARHPRPHPVPAAGPPGPALAGHACSPWCALARALSAQAKESKRGRATPALPGYRRFWGPTANATIATPAATTKASSMSPLRVWPRCSMARLRAASVA